MKWLNVLCAWIGGPGREGREGRDGMGEGEGRGGRGEGKAIALELAPDDYTEQQQQKFKRHGCLDYAQVMYK